MALAAPLKGAGSRRLLHLGLSLQRRQLALQHALRTALAAQRQEVGRVRSGTPAALDLILAEPGLE